MSSAKKFAPGIEIHKDYLTTLKSMEYEAYRWMGAACGKRKAYHNPVGMLLARDIARQALDRYFEAIEKLIPKKKEGEPA